MTYVELAPSNGTLVRSAAPTLSYYAASKSAMRVENNSALDLLKYQLPAALIGSKVNPTYLRFTPLATWAVAVTLTGHRHAALAAGYSYPTVDWTHRPGKLTGATDCVVTGTGILLMDVTAELQAIADGGAWYGFRVLGNANPAVKFNGWQTSSDLAPLLLLDFAAPGDAPSGLSPNGVVSIAAPHFTWHGDPDATRHELLIDDHGGDMSTPLFDSGAVAGGDQGLDSATAGWAGQSNGGTVDAWVREGFPEWGDWSPVAVVIRRAFPTVALGALTGNDPTPPHLWTITGGGSEPQTKYRVRILDAADRSIVYFDSSLRGGTAGGLTPTAGPPESTSVVSVLEVWFGNDRVASPGDSDHVTVERTWTWSAGSGTPATSVTWVQDGKKPKGNLHIVRGGAAPDGWLIADADGKPIDLFEAIDHTAGANTWDWPTWLLAPNQETPAQLKVAPITNGAVGPWITVDAPLTVTGTWLVDPVTGRHFSINNSPDAALSEGTSVLTAIDGTEIWHNYGLGGWAGTLAGDLWEYDGRTAGEQRDDLAAMRSTPERTYRLIWGDQNIPVRIKDASAAPSVEWFFNDGTTAYDVKLTFKQHGEIGSGAG